MGVPQNGWFIRGNPIKMDDFRGTPILGNLQITIKSPVVKLTLSCRGMFFPGATRRRKVWRMYVANRPLTLGFPKIGVPLDHSCTLGFSIVNHPFWGNPIYGNVHILHRTVTNANFHVGRQKISGSSSLWTSLKPRSTNHIKPKLPSGYLT